MAKIKFTKAELKHQQDDKKQFERFLPTLQLKKQQLQMEVRLSTDLLENNLAAQKKLDERISRFIQLYGDDATTAAVQELVKVVSIKQGSTNIAGVNIPVFEKVEFADTSWDLFSTDWALDDLVETLKEAVSLRCAYMVLERQHALLSAELRSTTQRVNLFEKVKIPECEENIRRINIMLGDANTSSVARSKIAKKKSMTAA